MRMTPEILARMETMKAEHDAPVAADRDRPLTVGEFRDGIDRLIRALGVGQDKQAVHCFSYGASLRFPDRDDVALAGDEHITRRAVAR